MPSMVLVMDGDGAWPDLKDKKVHHVTSQIQVAPLGGGMASGKASVTFRIDLADGSVVLAETSLELFSAAARAMNAKFGTDR